jgi:hypothetical protein
LIVVSPSNGICPRYCTCAILYEELIQDALKECSDDYERDNEYPDYEEYMAIAKVTYWRAKSEQICCQLNDTVRLPDCVEKIAHDYIQINGYADEDIPAHYCGRDGTIDTTIDVPTQRGTQSPPESLSGDADDDSKAKLLRSSEAKSVKGKSLSEVESDGEKTLPLSTTSGSPPGTAGTYKSPHRLEFDEAALKEYKKASPSEQLDSALDEYEEAENRGAFEKKHLDKVLALSQDLSQDFSSNRDTVSEGKKPAAYKSKQSNKSKQSRSSTTTKSTYTYKRLMHEDDIEDPTESDPKFLRVVKRRLGTDQLTLTQYWPNGTGPNNADP